MRTPMKTAGFALICAGLLPLCAQAQSAQTIYKHVDEGGRVTYSNSPIKGAERVSLQPITVLPSSPTPNVAVARVTAAPRVARSVATSTMNVSAPAKAEDSTATVKEAPFEAAAVVTAALSLPATPTGVPAASNAVNGTVNRIRPDDSQRRNLLASLLGEQESLANAKAKLAEESKNTESIRALRASFTAAPDKSGVRKVITPEMRAQVEQHFERVRDLQDEISMHEQNVASLRSQLRAEPPAGVMAAQ